MAVTPSIKVSFYFTGDSFDLDYVSSKMMKLPTETRTKESFPIDYFAHTEWSIDWEIENCKAVSLVFDEVIKVLKDKIEDIKKICSELNVKVGFNVVIKHASGDMPELVLPSKIINFLSSINAELGFDLYCCE